jgi:hypothetical protein
MLAEMGVTLWPDPTMVDRGGVTQQMKRPVCATDTMRGFRV